MATIDYASPGIAHGYPNYTENLKTVYGKPVTLLNQDVAYFRTQLRKLKGSNLGGDTFKEFIYHRAPGGDTLSKAQSGIVNLRPAKGAVGDNVEIRGCNYYKSIIMSPEYQKDAESPMAAFEAGTRPVMEKAMDDASYKLEALYIHSQSSNGYGVLQSGVTTWSTGATKVVPVTKETFLYGFWPHATGYYVDVWASTLGTGDKRNTDRIYVDNFDPSATAPTLTLKTDSGNAPSTPLAFVAGDLIVPEGLYEDTGSTVVSHGCVGLLKALSVTAGVLNGIDNTLIPGYKAQQYAMGGPVSIQSVRRAILQGQRLGYLTKGMDLRFIASPVHLNTLNDEFNFLLQKDASYASSLGEAGFDRFCLYGNGIKVEMVPHSLLNDSVGMILDFTKENLCIAGPTDLDWEPLTPDGSLFGPLFPYSTGYGALLHDKTSPYVRLPNVHTLITGMTY